MIKAFFIGMAGGMVGAAIVIALITYLLNKN